jgi:Na+-transporting methylmalonyl-CoA/oxaloacetate decarboxylase gamma subunit
MIAKVFVVGMTVVFVFGILVIVTILVIGPDAPVELPAESPEEQQPAPELRTE